MTLQECYLACGGEFLETLMRLPSERMIEKFLVRFLEDRSYAELAAGMTARDGDAAFRAAHTLKGVALNLGLRALYEPASALTEKLRGGWDDEAAALLPEVTKAYDRTADAIRKFKEGSN